MKSGSFMLEKLERIIDMLTEGNPLPYQYNNHKLIGNYAGHWECHIESDLLLVYKIEEDRKAVVLVDIGSHAYIFGM